MNKNHDSNMCLSIHVGHCEKTPEMSDDNEERADRVQDTLHTLIISLSLL